MSTTTLELVTLTGGLTVSLPALQLAWDLENRGLRVRLSDDGGLIVSPRSRISVDDDVAIRQHKAELIQLAGYVETVQ